MCNIPSTWRTLLASSVLALVAGTASPARAGDTTAQDAAARFAGFHLTAAGMSGCEITMNPREWDALLSADGAVTIERFPLAVGNVIALRLERFYVTTPDTRFVVGRAGGADRPLAFDPERVVLLRGRADGFPHSSVFLALSDVGCNGFVDLGTAGGMFSISARGYGGAALEPGRLMVFQPKSGGSLPPDVPRCGVDTSGLAGVNVGPPGEAAVWSDEGGAGQAVRSGPIRGLQQLEMAIDTDYEFYALFGDLEAAAAYVVSLYGADSTIYTREVNTRLDLTFVRLWDDPNDLFNAPDPLDEFVEYWEQNMGHVRRDATQFFSGRRNLPYGGIAYVEALCEYAYSVCGYALGFFASVDEPHVDNFDIMVTSHELGHGCGSYHTNDYGLDNCPNPDAKPRRGTIMSYCSQTVPGGEAVTDLRFERVIQNVMKSHINSVSCVADDCNQNGRHDGQDISLGFSQDANGNGIPDECEDCNGNGILDSRDIAEGRSRDEDRNGVPDECQPDCNGNGLPDTLDISRGTSRDDYQNNIPDECEADCNGNRVSDYNEIMNNMDLDINRNTRLDNCEDCDGDGTPDHVELAGAHTAWIASLTDGVVKEFHGQTGVRSLTSVSGRVGEAQDLIITPDRRVLVSSGNDDRVVEFNAAGQYVGDLVSAGAGGLDYPTGLLQRPEGSLLVASRNTNSVLEYDVRTGAFLREFVTRGSGGLTAPFGLTLGPGGDLFVSCGDDQVRQYHGATGTFVRIFVSRGGNGGLSNPRGLVFKPDGNLLVCSHSTRQVLEYDAAGRFVGQFNNGGTNRELTLDGPWGIRIGPSGHVYVSRQQVPRLHINRTRIYMFDVRNGNFIHNFVNGNASGLWNPTGFDFMPGWKTDCNGNFVPDNCDIASGRSEDRDRNGVPDECEHCAGDVDGDGDIDLGDLAALLALFGATEDQPRFNRHADFDRDGRIGQGDLAALLAVYGEDCPE